jgi:hypothetical protein
VSATGATCGCTAAPAAASWPPSTTAPSDRYRILKTLGRRTVAGARAWLALALFALAFVVGAAYQSRATILAERAGERGDDAEARRQLARWVGGYLVIVGLLVVIAWDMVFKPGL